MAQQPITASPRSDITSQVPYGDPSAVNSAAGSPSADPKINRPIISTNRSARARDVVLSRYPDNTGILPALENTPPYTRGDRRRPTIIKFPTDIGTGQYPHVMQFKVFWRWEAKELQDIKAEEEKKVQTAQTMNAWNRQYADTGMGVPLSMDQVRAINEMKASREFIKTIDPSKDQNYYELVAARGNTMRANRQLSEETVQAYQSRVSVIETELSNGSVNSLDDTEREQVNSRLGEVLENTSAGEAGIKVGAVTFAAVAGRQLLTGLLEGKDLKSAAIDAGIDGTVAGGASGLVVAGTIAAAKALQNQPVHDQMVSIYLPVCTKIGNEETFVYEDASGAAVAGALDVVNNMTDGSAQAAVVGSIYGANKIGMGGAFAALSGLVVNPRLEKVFRAKDFRSFSFSWDFYPRTPEESEKIRDIVETFRYHANPAYDEEVVGQNSSNAKLILRAPAEFSIRFLSTNSDPNAGGFVENPYIPKIARCACTSINVDYAPNGFFSTYRDNAPTAITLTMNFQEIETLTREAIDKGF